MIISGLQIQTPFLKGKQGEANSPQIKAAWEVSKACKDKMSALNAPFDIFLKECVQSDLARKGGENDDKS